jgi:hypothetical protein
MLHHMPSRVEAIGVDWKTSPSSSCGAVVIAAAMVCLGFRRIAFCHPSVPNQIEIIGEVRVNGKPQVILYAGFPVDEREGWLAA